VLKHCEAYEAILLMGHALAWEDGLLHYNMNTLCYISSVILFRGEILCSA